LPGQECACSRFIAAADTPTSARALPFASVAQEQVDQGDNVRSSLAQGRNLDADDVQPVVQVLPKAPFTQQGFDRTVGRSDKPGLDGNLGCAAQGAHPSVFQNVQQLRLDFQRKLADFVEKERAVCGRDKGTGPVLFRVG